MDRLSRPLLAAIVAIHLAIVGGELARRVFAVRGAPVPAVADGDWSGYPPRLLELPEGVIPVALRFAPPPLSEAPLSADEFFGTAGTAAPAPLPVRAAVAAPQRLPEIDAPAETWHTAELLAPANAPPSYYEPSVSLPPVSAVAALPSEDRNLLPLASVLRAPVAPREGSNRWAADRDRQLAAVENRAQAATDRALALAQRGAAYTARAELVQSLRMIAQSLDAADGTTDHRDSLTAAFRALDEAEDFQLRGAGREAAPNLENLVLAHRTPVLKHADLRHVTAIEAMQHYYTFAQQRLAAAGGQRKSASQSLYGLGKLHAAMAERLAGPAAMDGPKVMVYYQAAPLVDPHHHLAANELGVLLARYGQWDEAKSVFLHGVSVRPTPQTWHNLAAVHERLGEADLAARARFELSQLAPGGSPIAAAGAAPAVEWLTPAEFAATGEKPLAPRPVAAPAPRMARPGDVEWYKPWTWF